MKKIVILVSILLLCGCTSINKKEVTFVEDFEEMQVNGYEVEIPKPTLTKVSFSAIGDILLHEPVYRNAWNGNTYDFNPMFEEIKPYIENSDISIANQETMIGGVEFGLSSYPSFNSPQSIGDTLKWAGVDLVTLANNHSLDRGEKVIQASLNYWGKIGMIYDGAYRSVEDSETIRVIESKGIDISSLSYTYGTNGIPIPQGKEYLVNLLDKDKMKMDLDKAKEISDIQIVSMHFGSEYQRLPNETQKKWVEWLSEEGVDVVVGHHPHVLQPMEWVENSKGEKTLVIYSLGNFISNQKGNYKDIGGIAKFDIVKEETLQEENFYIENPSFIPTFSGKNSEGNFKISLLSEKNPEIFKEITIHMNQWIPDLMVK